MGNAAFVLVDGNSVPQLQHFRLIFGNAEPSESNESFSGVAEIDSVLFRRGRTVDDRLEPGCEVRLEPCIVETLEYLREIDSAARARHVVGEETGEARRSSPKLAPRFNVMSQREQRTRRGVSACFPLVERRRDGLHVPRDCQGRVQDAVSGAIESIDL